MGRGRVIGVDIEIRPHNRKAIESHEMAYLIDLVEGSSVAPNVVEMVAAKVKEGECCLVILDSNHTRAHVLEELRKYSSFVKPGSWIIACDGIMQDMVGAPRSRQEWATDNPQSAVNDFLAERDDFELVEPDFPFNEGDITKRVTYWPNAYLRCVR